MKRWEKTGVLHHVNEYNPQYGDFSNVQTYLEAATQVKQAEQEFANLPSRIRNRFNNNPVELLEFMQNEENFEEAVELGLVRVPDEPEEEPSPRAVTPKVESDGEAD